jgi:hypothetical protein
MRQPAGGPCHRFCWRCMESDVLFYANTYRECARWQLENYDLKRPRDQIVRKVRNTDC